jgi:hypothetical protein
MIDAGNTENEDITLPDNPPNIIVARAKSQANALACCIYVYRCRSNWVMTTDPSQPPVDVAVWMVPANQNDAGGQNWLGRSIQMAEPGFVAGREVVV